MNKCTNEIKKEFDDYGESNKIPSCMKMLMTGEN